MAIIIGASGFIGSYVVNGHCDYRWAVRGLNGLPTGSLTSLKLICRPEIYIIPVHFIF